MTRSQLLTIALMTTLLFCSLGAQSGVPPSVPFEPATAVTGGGLGPMSHAMAVAADGTIYLASDDLNFDNRRTIHLSRFSRALDNGQWTDRVVAIGEARWPRLAVAPNGDVYVVYLGGK